jgi:hypothetical protein
MESDKKEGANKKNQDIRSFFNSNSSNANGNKRVMKVIEPFLKEINEDSYKLRERKIINYKDRFNLSSPSNSEAEDAEENENINSNDNENGNETSKSNLKKKRLRMKKLGKKIVKKESKKNEEDNSVVSQEEFEDEDGIVQRRSIYDNYDYIELRNVKNFSKIRADIQKTISEAKQEIKKLEKAFFVNEHQITITKSRFPDDCIPVTADIRTFDWTVSYHLFRNLLRNN